ncbi:3'-5' exoribonuclease YhaM family protein [Phascolarctobacterium faecium]|uniref:3'-5' exoribonuclease YhaM family protein n=1 Tax=Phascolarctobacterium faecium TaxID=33025 RepID=UPI00351FC884
MISDFKAGTKVCQAVLLRVQKIGNSSNGGVFARGLLEDNSGKMPFIVFEAGIVDKMRSMEGPKVMMVGGMVDINKFSNDMTLQLVLQRMEEIMPEDDITHLLPNGDFDHQEYENKLQKLIKGVMTPGIRLILENIFSGTLYDKFLINPAGMRLHHAYIGGLLQHSVDVAGIAQSLADRIGGVDKDLIVAGALLHDIGKIREISSDIGFPYTMEGRLLGHVSMSAVMVQEAAGKAKVTGAKLQQLLHIVLSHHGEQEKGSPVACATKESFIVHYADEIDAIMNQFSKNEGKNPWEYNKMLQRFLLHEA